MRMPTFAAAAFAAFLSAIPGAIIGGLSLIHI